MKKKLLSVLLCITILFSLLPALPIAAEQNIVFEDDFEALNVGDSPKASANEQGMWSAIVQKDTVRVSVASEGKNNVLRLSNDGSTDLRGPRIEKNLNLNGVEKVTFSFRVRVEGDGAKFALQWLADSTSNNQLYFTNACDWKL